MERRRAGDRGASLVELAFILPVFALLVFGTIDLVRAYRLDVRLENAAREGAAFAQIRPNDVDCASGPNGDVNDIIGRVTLEDADLPSVPGFIVRSSYGDAGSPLVEYYDSSVPTADRCRSEGDAAVVGAGQRVEVEVGATFDVLTPLIGAIVGDTIDMTSAAEVEVQG